MPALVQSKVSAAIATTSLSFSSSTTAGNCVVVVTSIAVTAVTLGGSAGNFAKAVANTGSTGVAIWVDPNCAGSQTAIATTGGDVFAIYEASGVATTSPVDKTSSSQQTSGGPFTTFTSAATGTTTQATEFWIGAVEVTNGGTGNESATGPSSPWTNLAQIPTSAASIVAMTGYQVTSSTGTATYSGTSSTSGGGSGFYGACVVALLPNSTPKSISDSGSGSDSIGSPSVTAPLADSGQSAQALAISATAPLPDSGQAADSIAVTVYPAFPTQPLGMKIELLLNGTWTDITDYVQQRAPIVVTRGRPNESSQATPCSMSLTLNNQGGNFSPGNSAGIFYPFIARNIQIRVSVTAASVSGQLVTGSYRFWGEVSAWPPSWDSTGKDVYVPIVANGVLQRYQQGANIGSALYRYWTRLAGAYVPVAYWPCEDGTSATSFANSVTPADAMTWTGTPNLATDTGFGGSDPLPQFNASAWTGTTAGYSNVSPAVFTTPGTYSWTAPGDVSSLTSAECWGGGGGGGSGNIPAGGGGGGGEYAKETSVAVTPGSTYTVTVGAGGAGASAELNGNGQPGTLSTFPADSVTVTAHPGGAGAYASGTGGSAGSGSSNTTHHSGGTGGTGSSNNGGASGGTSSAGTNGNSGGTAVTGGGPGGVAPATNSPGVLPVSGPGGGGSGGGANNGYTTGGSGYAGQVTLTFSTGSVPAANVVRFALDVPAAGCVDGTILVQALTGGTVAKLNVFYHTGGNLELIGYNAGGASIFDSGSQSFGANGQPMIVSVELTKSGSNVAWKLTAQNAGAGSPVATYTGSVSGSLGSVSEVQANVGGTETGTTAVGHIGVQYAVSPLTDAASAASGYAGELAGNRFIRLCTEQGIGYSLVGNASDTPQMGPQVDDKLVSLLQGIEDLDRGLLYETRGMFGLAYRTRVSMQNQSPAVTYDYSLGELAQNLQPTQDDQLIRNDVTMTRSGGSSARQYLASGALSIQDPPNGVGDYTYALTVAAYADSQLANLATWVLDVGTVNEYRYPQITIDLSRSAVASLFTATAALSDGGYAEIINPPSFLTASAIKQLAWGFTETLNAFIWTIALNAVPESVYEGAGLPTW